MTNRPDSSPQDNWCNYIQKNWRAFSKTVKLTAKQRFFLVGKLYVKNHVHISKSFCKTVYNKTAFLLSYIDQCSTFGSSGCVPTINQVQHAGKVLKKERKEKHPHSHSDRTTFRIQYELKAKNPNSKSAVLSTVTMLFIDYGLDLCYHRGMLSRANPDHITAEINEIKYWIFLFWPKNPSIYGMDSR